MSWLFSFLVNIITMELLYVEVEEDSWSCSFKIRKGPWQHLNQDLLACLSSGSAPDYPLLVVSELRRNSTNQRFHGITIESEEERARWELLGPNARYTVE